MNDLKYFRNDKLDLVNKEKQRFGFRKLSSGKIASVLLGVTIFGSFALNGQVVKADTTAVVNEAKNKQTDEEEGQDTSAQKASSGEESHEAQTGTVTPGTTSGSEAETGKTQAYSTGTDTPNANRGGTTSDTNGAGAAAKVGRIRAAEMQSRSISNQPTADQLVDYYKDKVSKDKKNVGTALDKEHAQSLLDYYNNLETVTNILDLSSSSYGEVWLESAISKRTSNLSNEVVNRTITYVSQRIVTDTQAKIDKQIEKLEQLAKNHPNNQEIQNAINNLRDAKNSVTVDNMTNANAMKNAIGTLDKYGSKQAYDKLKQDAEKVNKDDLQSAVNEAATVKAANSQASEDKQKAYQDAIAAGQNVLNDGKASQADVTNALSKIEQAKKDMTVSAIQKAVDEASDTKGKPNYYNASDEAKKAYNDALDKANRVLADPKATQDQLDEANSALTSAKAGLTGVATDNSGLEKAVNEANTTKLDDKYYNASQDKKQAYDEALAQATKLLNDKTASQKAVDDAVANLEKAKAELNGEPNFIGGDYTPSEPSTPSTETPAEKTTEKILMHASYLYDNKGIKIDKPTVKSYVTVVVAENPVTINGIKYYKVAGKDEYIKAGNIDGTLRVITHNSYIYNNKGKATRNKGIKRLVKKTRIVRTYGAPINIKGHMMYRIAKNRYIKARNFEGTLRRLSHNSFVYDENGKATRNKGIRRLLKKSRVVRTFDAPVKINGHMMYRVDNGYVKVKNFK